jgi:hypothetical protein
VAEPELIKFEFKEVATALVKQADLHSGIWAIYFEFGIGAANITDGNNLTLPAAFVPVVKLGLRRVDAIDNLSVDAAEINPKPKVVQPKGGGQKKGRAATRRPVHKT